MPITLTPLGAGQEVGRSCVIVRIKEMTIMFDCGVHMAWDDHRKFPNFKLIVDDYEPDSKFDNKELFVDNEIITMYKHLMNNGIDYTKYVDLVIISHFHLDHCGALPYFTEICGYNGPILASKPTKSILPLNLEDFRKIISEYKGKKSILSKEQVTNSIEKVNTIELGEEIIIKNRIKVQSYYAGHVLGACMFRVEVDGYSVVYTGDYNTSADRHLGGAYMPCIRPDLFITETTYGSTIRDTKRVREREFTQKIQEVIDRGGKVLIPVFALGRAQELCIILDTYWDRTKSEIPIYFAGPMSEKATFYYKLFNNWTNEKLKSIFVEKNVFDFKLIQSSDKTSLKRNVPMVIFATPGMLHGGYSVQVFKEIAPDSKNCVIIPGYCTAGTLGNKVLSGERKVEIDKKYIDVRCEIYYMSFSAHADAKGILQLVKNVAPKNLILVHGDVKVMEVFKKSVESTLAMNVEMPANHQTINFKVNTKLYYQINMTDYMYRMINFITNKSIGNEKNKTFSLTCFKNNSNNELTLINPLKSNKEYSIKITKVVDVSKLISFNLITLFKSFLKKRFPDLVQVYSMFIINQHIKLNKNGENIEFNWISNNSSKYNETIFILIKIFDCFVITVNNLII